MCDCIEPECPCNTPLTNLSATLWENNDLGNQKNQQHKQHASYPNCCNAQGKLSWTWEISSCNIQPTSYLRSQRLTRRPQSQSCPLPRPSLLPSDTRQRASQRSS